MAWGLFLLLLLSSRVKKATITVLINNRYPIATKSAKGIERTYSS